MKTEYITLKEAPLNNNCPECFSSDGMTLSFKQKIVSTKLWSKTKGTVIQNIFCSKCENQIYAGQWTNDIERVFEYHKKTINVKRSSLRFTSLFYLLFFILLVMATGGYIFINYPELLGISK